jgi:hypothetical protein
MWGCLIIHVTDRSAPFWERGGRAKRLKPLQRQRPPMNYQSNCFIPAYGRDVLNMNYLLLSEHFCVFHPLEILNLFHYQVISSYAGAHTKEENCSTTESWKINCKKCTQIACKAYAFYAAICEKN